MVRKSPYIEELDFKRESLDAFISELKARPNGSGASNFLLDYPTVYVVFHEESAKFRVYVGETTDIRSRTLQHLERDRDDWRLLAASPGSRMFVIGHQYFNKSLTLDVENRLMLYLSGSELIEELYNRRTNPQNKYYTHTEFDEVFESIWRGLRKRNKKLFPAEDFIKNSALFKASPFHKLTQEQLDAKGEALALISTALENHQDGQLIMVSGEAGAGKTVLLSSLFYELFQGQETGDDPFEFKDLDAYLLVNHDEQLTVYQQVAKKLGLIDKHPNRVTKPTSFINSRSTDEKAEVILVDEGHLLWTQGKQSYRGSNQLADLLDRAKVVVLVFDENQILRTNQYWEPSALEWLRSRTTHHVELKNQMRIDASEETVRWLRRIIDEQLISEAPVDDFGRDDHGYELKIFDSPHELHSAIQQRADSNSEMEKGLSRLLATYDWPYSSSSSPEDGGTWSVRIDDWEMPWNRETMPMLSRTEARMLKDMAWAEMDHTIDEVGSTFTIQGFDLNFAGVIVGPSVKFRDGRVVFDPTESANKGATQKRTLLDGTKVHMGERLIRNELNVLLTRGVNGLYIYAVDEELRDALHRSTGRLL